MVGIDRPIGGQRADRRIGRERRHRGLVHADDGPRTQPALDLQPVPLNQRLHRVRRAGQDQAAALAARHLARRRRARPRARKPRGLSAMATPTIAHSTHTATINATHAEVRPSFHARGRPASLFKGEEARTIRNRPSLSELKSAEEHSAYGRATEQDLCQIAETATCTRDLGAQLLKRLRRITERNRASSSGPLVSTLIVR